jgi:hypothetical protein
MVSLFKNNPLLKFDQIGKPLNIQAFSDIVSNQAGEICADATTALSASERKFPVE